MVGNSEAKEKKRRVSSVEVMNVSRSSDFASHGIFNE